MKLLVAVDGSDHATHAARVAGHLAAASGAEVVVFHQRSDARMPHGPAAPPDETAERAQAVVDAAVDVALEAGAPKAVGRIGRGLADDVARAIIDVAAREEADVIVVGPRGFGRVRELLVGSVTERLVHHADRPVLVVR